MNNQKRRTLTPHFFRLLKDKRGPNLHGDAVDAVLQPCITRILYPKSKKLTEDLCSLVSRLTSFTKREAAHHHGPKEQLPTQPPGVGHCLATPATVVKKRNGSPTGDGGGTESDYASPTTTFLQLPMDQIFEAAVEKELWYLRLRSRPYATTGLWVSDDWTNPPVDCLTWITRVRLVV